MPGRLAEDRIWFSRHALTKRMLLGDRTPIDNSNDKDSIWAGLFAAKSGSVAFFGWLVLLLFLGYNAFVPVWLIA